MPNNNSPPPQCRKLHTLVLRSWDKKPLFCKKKYCFSQKSTFGTVLLSHSTGGFVIKQCLKGFTDRGSKILQRSAVSKGVIFMRVWNLFRKTIYVICGNKWTLRLANYFWSNVNCVRLLMELVCLFSCLLESNAWS